MPGQTIPQLFEESVNKYSQNILMHEKKDSKYSGKTYGEIKESVYFLAAGLIEAGLSHGDRVALISEGRNDWLIAELGILFTGAINVPISVKIEELTELKFRLAHSECRFVFVSGTQLDKVRKIKIDLPELEKIIILDRIDNPESDEILFADILKSGMEYLKSNLSEFEARWKNIKGDDYANICYTSGTTADPKGIILTHRNYTANVEQSSGILHIPESYKCFLILPWDHAFAHTVGLYTMIKNGASIVSVATGKSQMETLKNIPLNIMETKPTFILSVPVLAKNFRKNIEKGIKAKGPKVEKLFIAALTTAYKYNAEGWNKGRAAQRLKKPLLKIFDKLIFQKIRENFGGRLEFFIGGGALLDIELQRFFYAIGIPMYQGYGLTEAAPVISANVPAKHKLGSSGSILPGLEVRICDEKGNTLKVGDKGEIVVRGENVMKGYWKNERATNQVLKDGWLFSGDIGYMDKDGFLFVLGRDKSLLIGSDGEKYSPEGIEEAITEYSPYIEQFMLYNNQSPYTVALLVPNLEPVSKWIKEKNISPDSNEGKEAVLRLFQSEITEFHKSGKNSELFPSRWIPSTFAVLGEAFTEQNKLLNSTLKMVRGRIADNYRNRIDYMFTPEGKEIINHQNLNIIGKIINEIKP